MPVGAALVSLAYNAPSACPDVHSVEAAVRARTPHVDFAPAADRAFEIAIEERDGTFVGTLSVASDPTSARQLSAHRCDDLVAALALITALAIDPQASEPAPVARPSSPQPPWSIEAAMAAGVASGIAPDAMPALAIEGTVEPRHSLVVALAGAAAYDRATFDVGAARFVWAAVRPAACWRFQSSPFEIDTCAHLEIGAVWAAGQGIVLGQSVTRSWLAPGAHVDARWRFSPSTFLQLEVSGSAPTLRDRYMFQPSTSIHETAAVTTSVALGAGVHFR